jgi:hypothetical protein
MNARTKLIGTVVLGTALLAPVAQAQRPDDRAAARGPGAIAAVQSSASRPDDRAVHGTGAVHGLEQAAVGVRPDDRAGMRGPGAVTTTSSTATRPDDRAEPRGPGAVSGPLEVRTSSTGFDWDDAFIGGIGGAGLALLLTGCFFLLLGQRNKTRLA